MPDMQETFVQTVLPVEFTAPTPLLGVTLGVTFARHPRGRCNSCHQRRVLFSVGLGEFLRGPKLCAKCAGIR